MFSIGAGIRESLGNVVVKDIKGSSSLRPRPLKLKISNRNLLRIGKAHFNVTAVFNTYILIIRTKGVRFYTMSLIVSL